MIKQRIKSYRKSDIVGYALDRFFMKLGGWYVVSEEETQGYSGSKGLLLAILWLPLALFGHTKYIKVTYERA